MQDLTNQAYAKRLQQLNFVKRFLESQNPLMLIVGEKGSGKTNLLSDIVLQMRVSRHIIRLQGQQGLHPSQLAKVLSKHWAVKNTDKDLRIESQITQMLDGLAEHKQSCVLVIDDAHLLSLSMLAALSHIATQQDGKPVCLHLLLSGRPILAEKMSNLQTKEIPQITVGALPREEAFRKIKALLDKAGMALPHDAANAILTKIFQRSGGMPETLENMVTKLIAQRTAIDTPPEKKHTATVKTKTVTAHNFWKQHHVKTISLLGLIATGILLYYIQHHPKKLITWPKDTIQFTQSDLSPIKKVSRPPPIVTTPPKAHIVVEKRPHPTTAIASPKKNTGIYTLQLMSGENKGALASYIKKHRLDGQAQAMKTQLNGHDWYVLVYGHYTSPRKAKEALAHLPGLLQQLHPWVRSNKQLHSLS